MSNCKNRNNFLKKTTFEKQNRFSKSTLSKIWFLKKNKTFLHTAWRDESEYCLTFPLNGILSELRTVKDWPFSPTSTRLGQTWVDKYARQTLIIGLITKQKYIWIKNETSNRFHVFRPSNHSVFCRKFRYENGPLKRVFN